MENGDGAIAASMIAIPLYERYIVGDLKIKNIEANDDNKKAAIGDDLSLDDGKRAIFWEVFRNGFMHQAMGKAGRTKWRISKIYDAIPSFENDESGATYVAIDPWKFADRTLEKFETNPQVITASESFPLATIFEIGDTSV